MLGYVLGVIATSLLAEWARESGRELLGDLLNMCSALFQIAFVFGVLRLLLRGSRRMIFSRRQAASERMKAESSVGETLRP